MLDLLMLFHCENWMLLNVHNLSGISLNMKNKPAIIISYIALWLMICYLIYGWNSELVRVYFLMASAKKKM